MNRYSLKSNKSWVEQCQQDHKRVVLTNGCFDLLHVGHIRYLQESRSLGDYLIVALNSDKSVKSYKGQNRPIVPQEERAEMLMALACVDAVVIFDEPTVDRVIMELKPDIYTKGGDYTLETINKDEKNALESVNTKIEFISFVENQSTTSIVERILS